jgi:hypothetical protein
MRRAWADEAFRERLIAQPQSVLAEHGYTLDSDSPVHLEVVASDEQTVYLYLPCPDELADGTDSDEAAATAASCPNNQLVSHDLVRRSLASGQPD